MTFLPIVNRELRVASRRRGTYWSRCATTALATIGAFVIYLANSDNAPYEVAQIMFYAVSAGAFLYCLFVGVRATADCLSEEKREGTLGLLFLTDLKGYDVVGGKLVATSLNAFYGLLAIFPVLAVPLLMGGVTNGEFWRMALVLANTFLFSLATGMFMSAINKSPRVAMAETLVFLLVVSLGLYLACGLMPFVYNSPHRTLAAHLCNPGYPVTLVPDAEFAAGAKLFWWSVGIIQGTSWVFLALACAIVPRSWQDHPKGAGRDRLGVRWREWSFGDTTKRLQFRRRLLGINPFLWLAGRARLKPGFVWGALGIIACLWFWGALEDGRAWMDAGNYAITSIILNCMLKLWITSEAGRRFGEDRKIGALELILSTPLSVREILRGQWLALRRQFLGPTIAVVLVQFIFLLAALKETGTSSDEIPSLVAWWAAFSVMLVADMVALSTTAMWVGLTARNPNRTTGISMVRVLVLPDIIFLGSLILVSIMSANSNSSEPTWKFTLGAWLVPGVVADIYFGVRAWRGLRHEFRQVAAHRFVLRQSLFQRMFRRRPRVTEPAS